LPGDLVAGWLEPEKSRTLFELKKKGDLDMILKSL
jgi:hypothetical protein